MFDIFGIFSINCNVTSIFCIPEGHCPGGRTCNEVSYMLHFYISRHVHQNVCTSVQKVLNLHADNCSGQIKNRFFMFYFPCRFIARQYFINLRFFVAWHTKNNCGAAFVQLKRTLKRLYFTCPWEMVRFIEESEQTYEFLTATAVKWVNWKDIFPPFSIPTVFK